MKKNEDVDRINTAANMVERAMTNVKAMATPKAATKAVAMKNMDKAVELLRVAAGLVKDI